MNTLLGIEAPPKGLRYWNAARQFSGVRFYLGKPQQPKGKDRVVICKVGRRIVGVIMPIRAPM